MNLLSTKECGRLAELENLISAGQKTFVEVGLSLTEIRDAKLYRSDFQTFEAYCHGKWGWTRIRAYQLIEAAGVKNTLPENVKHVLQNDRQASALAKVQPKNRAEVLEKVVERGPVTAKAIKEASESMKWEQGATSTPQPRDHAPEDNESDKLWNLKRMWRKASKKDRSDFIEWTQKSDSK